MEYMKLQIPPDTHAELLKQKFLHVYWRLEFFKASGDSPPPVSFFGPEVDALLRKPWRGDTKNRTNLIQSLGLLPSESTDAVTSKGPMATSRQGQDTGRVEDVEVVSTKDSNVIGMDTKRHAKVGPKAKAKVKAKAKAHSRRRNADDV